MKFSQAKILKIAGAFIFFKHREQLVCLVRGRFTFPSKTDKLKLSGGEFYGRQFFFAIK